MTFGAVDALRSQSSITVTFAGTDLTTGLAQKADSIQVKDLTRRFDTTLIGVQQLTLSSLTGVENQELPAPGVIALSNNFGNPFTDNTSFYVTSTEETNIILDIFDVLGKRITGSATAVVPGVHRFLFEGSALESGTYFVVARAGSYQSSMKILKNTGSGIEAPRLVYAGLVSSAIEAPAGMGKAKDVGDAFRFIGYAKGFFPDTLLATPLRDTTCEFRYLTFTDSTNVIDRDGNIYHTVVIGNQTWMLENLKVTRFNDGTPIPKVTTNAAWGNLSTPGYCWYNNSTTYRDTYGALYNWYAVNTGKLAPKGWHVPSDSEWTALKDLVGSSFVAGEKLKEAGTAHWTAPNVANNSSGFTALPGGRRDSNGNFLDVGLFGGWWSTLEDSSDGAWYTGMNHDYVAAIRGSYPKVYGYSVRCIKD